MTVEHSDFLDWPNGMGYTPCSAKYRSLFEERNGIYQPGNDDGLTMNDLSPEDYQRWNELDSELANLQIAGHTGKGVRY